MSVRPKLLNPTFYYGSHEIYRGWLIAVFVYLERIGPNRLYSIRKKIINQHYAQLPSNITPITPPFCTSGVESHISVYYLYMQCHDGESW
jgi:hypothetical protein